MSSKTPLERWKEEKARREGKILDPNDMSYKKLGEPCSHPPQKRAKEGGWIVCLLCGKILNEDKED